MARKLSGFEARNAFDEIVKGLAKQHLRLTFRKRFGVPEVGEIDDSLIVKGGVVAELDKPVNNLLHEIPPGLKVTRLSGTAEKMAGTQFESPAGLTIGELLSADEGDQVLIVLGRRARLLVYFGSGSESVLVAREVVELIVEPKAPPRKRTSTRSTTRSRR